MYTFNTKILFIVYLAVFNVSFVQQVFSETNHEPNQPENASKVVESDTKNQIVEKRQKISAEAMSAIRETQTAMRAFDDGKTKEGLAALERAAGKLEIVLAKDPSVSLAPWDITINTYQSLASQKAIMAARSQATLLLSQGRVQEARLLLQTLASETVISISNIPLMTYPLAIKEAVRFVDQGKIDDAKQVLQTALNTLVVTQTVIPIPVMKAVELLKQAEALSKKTDRTSDEQKQMVKLLEGVRSELGSAQALGYGTKSDFKNMYKELDEIEKSVSSGQSSETLFTRLNSSFTQLRSKISGFFKNGTVPQ